MTSPDEIAAWNWREMEDERHAVLATPGDAHREWHWNTGIPMGTPGCPQDACHPVEDFEPEPEPGEGVRCAHCKRRHWTVADVKACAGTTAPAPEVPLNRFGNPLHETPCVCGTYDRCSGVRAEDAAQSGNWRDRFRAYND
jgi:hypothetical protein